MSAYKNRKQNIPYLREYRNFYFPIETSDESRVVPVMQREANRLDKLFAPVQPIRPRTDHSTWKKAIEEAERRVLPYRASMQEIYSMTILNGHVTACLQKRKDMISLKDFELIDSSGNVNDKATEIFKKSWFSNIVNYIHEAQFFGYSLITFGELENNNFKDLHLIRRDCISPDRKVVSFMPRVPSGIEFDNPNVTDDSGEKFYDWNLYVPTTSEIGISPCGYGLLYRVAMYEITLRNIIGWNSDYVESYGQPLKWAKTTSKFGEDEYSMLESALRNLGANGYLMTDPQTELEFVGEGGRGGGWQSYANLEERCIKTISKILLGHADALDSTVGKLGAAQGEKSETGRALANIEKSDSRFVSTVINDVLFPKLINLGFPIDGLKFQFKNDKEKQEEREINNSTNQAAANWLKTLSETGYKLKPEFVAERMNIPFEEFQEIKEKNDETEENDDESGFSKSVSARLKEMYNKHSNCKHE